MSVMFIPASQLCVFPGQTIEALANGKVRSLPNNQGFVLYGPYLYAAAGIYRVDIKSSVLGPETQKSYFDVFDVGRVHASRYYNDDTTLYVHLYETSQLEFRFKTKGEEILIRGVCLEPVLLDKEEAEIGTVRNLINRLIVEDSEPRAVFRLTDRLAALGAREEAEGIRADFVERRIDAGSLIRTMFQEINTPGTHQSVRPQVEEP